MHVALGELGESALNNPAFSSIVLGLYKPLQACSTHKSAGARTTAIYILDLYVERVCVCVFLFGMTDKRAHIGAESFPCRAHSRRQCEDVRKHRAAHMRGSRRAPNPICPNGFPTRPTQQGA